MAGVSSAWVVGQNGRCEFSMGSWSDLQVCGTEKHFIRFVSFVPR